jgi:hypothetical protein
MIVKEAKYHKVRKMVTERISDEVYGCDQCKKQIKEDDTPLIVTVFYNDKSLAKNKSGDTDKFEFCSWKCVLKFLPKIKSDYFVDLPYLHYDSKTKGTNASDLLKLLK